MPAIGHTGLSAMPLIKSNSELGSEKCHLTLSLVVATLRAGLTIFQLPTVDESSETIRGCLVKKMLMTESMVPLDMSSRGNLSGASCEHCPLTETKPKVYRTRPFGTLRPLTCPLFLLWFKYMVREEVVATFIMGRANQ